MLTIMGITAQTHGINIDDTEVTVKKIMGVNPRRVSCIKIIFNIFTPLHVEGCFRVFWGPASFLKFFLVW